MIDTGLWIDLMRLRSPVALKTFVAPYVNDPEARLAEPIAFELLRSATEVEARVLSEHFASMPKLTNADDLWSRAAKLGQDCRKKGITAGAIDLLIGLCRHLSRCGTDHFRRRLRADCQCLDSASPTLEAAHAMNEAETRAEHIDPAPDTFISASSDCTGPGKMLFLAPYVSSRLGESW